MITSFHTTFRQQRPLLGLLALSSVICCGLAQAAQIGPPPSFTLLEGKTEYAMHEPIRVSWIVPADFGKFTVKLGQNRNTPADSVPNLVVDPTQGERVGQFGFKGVTSLTTDKPGRYEIGSDKLNRFIAVNVKEGGADTFALSIINKKDTYRSGDTVTVQWTAPHAFQGNLSVGWANTAQVYVSKSISGGYGQTDFKLNGPGQSEVRIGYNGESHQIKSFAVAGPVLVK